MSTQLRRYTVPDEASLDRLAAWFPKLIPVRERFGFTVEWAHADYENLQFVWAVSHPGDDNDFAAALANYEPSPERAAAFSGFDNPILDMTVGMVEQVV